MLNGYQQKTKKAYENSAQIACEGAGNIRTVAALTREEDLWNIYHGMLDEPMRQGLNNAFYASIAYAFAQVDNHLNYMKFVRINFELKLNFILVCYLLN